MNNMRAALLLFVVSLCLAHASPGRRRQSDNNNNNNNNNLPSADSRQGGPAEDDDDGRIGFYHGPPEGFPSFDNIFPASSQSSANSPSLGRPSRTPQESSGDFQSSFEGGNNSPFLREEEEERRPSYNGGGSSAEDDEHVSFNPPSSPSVPVLRPSYSSYEDEDGGHYDGGPSGPSSSPLSGEEPRGSGEFNRHHENANQPFNSYEESYPPQHQEEEREQEQHYPPREEEAPQRGGQSTHNRDPHPHIQYSSSKEPIVLKVGSLNGGTPSKAIKDDGDPSVFYAPSPDIAYTTKNKNVLLNGRTQVHRHRQQPQQKPRARRSLLVSTLPVIPSKSQPPANNNKTQADSSKADSLVDPMLADGSTQSKSTLYWPSSPFISFDHYKTSPSSSGEDDSTARSDNTNINASSSSSSLHDSTSEEQRFFPSFPSPYLSPFSSRPHHLSSPLNFPGPSANHRPSRYSPPSASPLPFSKFPSRGPSSAASHDSRYTDTNILGSGNFEVVRGGTYYGDEGASRPSYGGHHGGGGGSYHSSPDSDDDYYSPPGNGHSSPYHGGGGGGGAGGGGGDFFANFRDFADINPHSRSFSHHRVQVLEGDEEDEETPEASSHSRTIRRSSSSSSSSGRRRPTFSMDYDPMVATF